MTTNRYPGINPHLNSALQQQDWKGFHSIHLVHLMEAIVVNLPRGYIVKLEDSLQLTARNDAGKYTGTDILIRRRDPIPTSGFGVAVAELEIATPTMTFNVFEKDVFVPAAIIYHDNRPVTRIELLSPANKHPGSHHKEYLKKRAATLEDGLRLVEIDYLHERQPLFPLLPSYPDQDNGAYPYMIIVSDPNKISDGGVMYGIGILDKLPTIAVPLENQDSVVVDFGAAYQRTFNSNPFFSEILTDYSQLPAKFSRYSPEDQARIQQHMASVATPPPQE